MTYWKYGNYIHPYGEINIVNLTVRNVHSGRGQQKHVLFQYYLRGEICADSGPDAISARIYEIEQAYTVEGLNCGLYTDATATTPTSHTLNNNHPNNISGNRVVQRPSFPEGGPTEYATGRTYSIIIQALFASPESQILEYQESIQYRGTGGPRWHMREFKRGSPRPYITHQRTAQHIVQQGRSLGFNGYLEPAGPILPSFEHQDARLWIPGTPEFHGQQYSEWPLQWAYYMTTTTAAFVPPVPV